MNIFTVCGDLLHVLSILLLLQKMVSLKNCKGISLKTQFLYALVFTCRYLDIFYNFASMYNWIMKLIFLSTSYYIIYIMAFHKPTCQTYDKQADSFHLLFVIAPCFVLALFVNEFFTFFEVLYTFSIYLEAVAILPQLIVVHRAAQASGGFVENLTSHYVFSLGGYRFFYLINWIYRIATEEGYRNWIVWIAGLVQTGIYCDFFYYFLVAKMEGKSMSLPI